MYYVEQKHKEYSTLVSGTPVVLKEATQDQLRQLYKEGNPYVKKQASTTQLPVRHASKEDAQPVPKQTKKRTKRTKGKRN